MITTIGQQHARLALRAGTSGGTLARNANGEYLIPREPMDGDWRAFGEYLKREPTDEEREAYSTAYVETLGKATAAVPEDTIEDLIEVSGAIVDNGIGPYEYAGQRGFHHDWQFEAEGEGIETIVWRCDEPPLVEEFVQWETTRQCTTLDRYGIDVYHEIHVVVRLQSLTVTRDDITIDRKPATQWRCVGTFSWEVAS
jgi:hypothetical protein